MREVGEGERAGRLLLATWEILGDLPVQTPWLAQAAITREASAHFPGAKLKIGSLEGPRQIAAEGTLGWLVCPVVLDHVGGLWTPFQKAVVGLLSDSYDCGLWGERAGNHSPRSLSWC